jgi:hypothetical protein
MGTFSPWFSGTPSYSTYSGDIGGGSLLSNRPGIKDVQKSQNSTTMVAMPKNTTVVNQTVQRPQQQKKDNTLNNIVGLSKMVKQYMDAPTDITGTGPSIPGYSMGMDLSGEEAIMAADALESQEVLAPAVENLGAKATVDSAIGVVPEVSATPMQLTGAGMAGVVGGKMGKYFGEWAGHELGMGGKREQDIIGGTLGGAAAGAMYGSVVPGVGTITGGLIGGAAGGIGNLFSIF